MRNDKGYSQEELAELANASLATIKIMEHIRKTLKNDSKIQASFENVISLKGFKEATNS